MIESTKSASDDRQKKIVLIAGMMRIHGRVGHHDYAAGCALLADLLARIPGIKTTVVEGGWPDNDDVLHDAAALVFYEGGNGKQAFLRDPQRLATMRHAAKRGVGLTMFHQAVAFPGEYRKLGVDWLGGEYVPGRSRRGHWKSRHRVFPSHPVADGVGPWAMRDGWLNGIQFVSDTEHLVPLLWSGKKHRGSPAGGNDDVVAWLYRRGDGGRSFAFTGLDAHGAWLNDGLRRLIANAIVWTSRLEPPLDTHWTDMSVTDIKAYQTPRRSRLVHELGKIRRIRHLRGRW